ncbi:MerR family transcriptional regulator [Clostridium sp. JN-1]|uniref:MerR family transcriptional regulator n=1 Tax=Clostridium sp. JN-1 TaxID=2483110 RepID=UPI000F0BBBE1|nr:MerR family transcriptional regulator [Clostridium sp. JN-1]
MKTVHEVSKLTGVSIRTLQYYDSISLLPASKYTNAGYRLYDDTALARLSQILLFRELEFPLKEIKAIIESPSYDKTKVLEDQIALLELKREHIDNLIIFARGVKTIGDGNMDFSAFDTKKLDEYANEAKSRWGQSAAYKEFEQKSKNRSRDAENAIAAGLMSIFEELGAIKALDPSSDKAQTLVKKLQSYITENYYSCTNETLSGLGKMYASDGKFIENIDKTGGKGTAEFVKKAIDIYCK